MHVARSLAMLAVALGAALGLVGTASAAPCAGTGIATTGSAIVRFSTSTNAVTQTLASPTTDPRGLAISPDGSTAYVADHAFSGAGAVYVIDTATMTRTATLDVPGIGAPAAATSLALSRDGSRLYVGYADSGAPRIRVIDTGTRETLTSYATPHGGDAAALAVSADGTTLYIGETGSGLQAVAAADGSGAQRLSAADFTVLRIVLSPDGATRYILGDTEQTILVQRGTAQATQLATPLGGRGLSLAIAPDGATLYAGVEGTGPGALQAVHATSGVATAVGPSAVAFGASAVAVAPDGQSIYAGTGSALVRQSPGGAAQGTISGVDTTGVKDVAICPAVAPGAPTAVTTDPGDTLVVVAWTAPGTNGGAAITGYTATASPGGATCTTTGATTCTVSGLRNTVGYTFTITATNVAGTSPASVASAKATPRKDNRARALAIGPASVSYTRKGVGVAFNVTATGPGVIAAAMTYKGDRYCSVSKRVTAAGVYRVRCVMAAAGRSLARKRKVTYTLLATFSPRNGPLASAKATVVVARRR